MKIKILILFFCSCNILNIQAQMPKFCEIVNIDSVKFEQINNNIKINYYLSGFNGYKMCKVKILCSNDGGKTFTIKPKTITNTGKFGLVKGKHTAIWNVIEDKKTLNGAGFLFKVIIKY